ncbi:SigE family RNA polymerase sigma factor [Spongisporangium articulatum]|uniref:SigE family RNA polymerase sigma factor n=1 Tax=Spongisporangium articulatum TaxID=3362603 RepID=A0ABW8AIV7_9ACTN
MTTGVPTVGGSPGAAAPEALSLEAFVAARGEAMLRLAWLLAADDPPAEDLVQEALTRVFRRWDSIAPGKHEAYVRTTIRSVWIDSFRRRGARVALDVVPEVPEAAGPDGGLEGTAVRLSLRAALARLTPRQRTVLVLRFYEDLSETETARAMSCSTSTVKSQTRYALARLRELAPELETLLLEGEVAR